MRTRWKGIVVAAFCVAVVGIGIWIGDHRETGEEPDAVPTGTPAAEVLAEVGTDPGLRPELTLPPTQEPTQELTPEPTQKLTSSPTQEPTLAPTQKPTLTPEPTLRPTQEPTQTPTQGPTLTPTQEPTQAPTQKPTQAPTQEPTLAPTQEPTLTPTQEPTPEPTQEPTLKPTQEPTQELTPTPAGGISALLGQTPEIDETDGIYTYYEFAEELFSAAGDMVAASGRSEEALLVSLGLRMMLAGIDFASIDINAPITRSDAALLLWYGAQAIGLTDGRSTGTDVREYVTDVDGCTVYERRAIGYLYLEGYLEGYEQKGQQFYPSEYLFAEDGAAWAECLKR